MNRTLQDLMDFTKGHDLILERFSHQNDLEKLFNDFLGFDIKFEDFENERNDYRIGVNLDLVDKLLYFDIYYLLDREDNLVITEISFDSDNAILWDDLNKVISPLEENNG
jgi:hypothetical protein